MVNARLHIICGNCGENKDLSYSIFKDSTEDEEKPITDCVIACDNCSTLHYLNTYIPREPDDD